MVLPNNFSSWEHLQTVLMQVQNRIVREEFNDLGGDDWDEDISTPRGSLRTACTLRDTDSAIETKLKLDLFYFCLGKAKSLQAPIYGIPVTTFQTYRRHKPQVHLMFKEVTSIENADPVLSQISFRIMDENFTVTDATTLANKIKAEFMSAGGYLWQKGKLMCAYSDHELGYQLQLLCRDEAEGKRVVTSVLSLLNHVPQWKYFSKNRNEAEAERYPENPPNKVILGKSYKQPKERTIHNSRFRYAELTIHGMAKPIILCDRSNTWVDVLVS